MKSIFLAMLTLIFFNSCDDDSSATGPSATPVTVVQMGLSGVESDFADNTSAQDTFIDNLANELNISDTD